MLQSIAKDKYDQDIFKEFGLIIFDEAHHAPSKYFSRALPIISSKKVQHYQQHLKDLIDWKRCYIGIRRYNV